MATANLNIMIKAFVEGLQQVQQLGTQLQQTGQQANILGGAGQQAGAGLIKMQGDIKTTADSVQSLTGYLKTAILAFVAYAGMKGLKETADFAARTETLGVTLAIVAKNAGYSTEEISNYEAQLKKSGITTQAARASMTAMIQAGIPLGPQLDATGKSAEGAKANIALLSRAAQDLAVITGKNSSETFTRLITNIQQLDSMGLRYMGITVDIVAAEQKWATANNTTVASMLQQQKILAVNNEVLLQAAKLTGAYEASMETVGKKVQSLTRYQDELRQVMGDKLLPAYGVLIDAATSFTKSLELTVKGLDASGAASKSFAEDISGLVNRISDFLNGIFKFVADNIDLFTILSRNVIGIGSDLLSLALTLGQVGSSGNVFQAMLWTLNLAVAGLRDGINLISAAALMLGGDLIGVAGLIVQGWGEIFSLIPGLKDFGAQMVSMGKSLTAVGSSSFDAGNKIALAFDQGRTATQDFLNGVKSADVALSNFGKADTITQVTKEIALLATGVREQGPAWADFSKAEKLVSKDLVALSQDARISADTILDLANQARAAGVEIPEGFDKVNTILKKTKDYAAEVRDSLQKVGEGNTFDQISKEIMTLVAAQRNSIITSAEAQIKYDTLANSIAKFAEGHPQAGAEVLKLQTQLGPVQTTIADAYTKSLTDMKKSTAELTTGVSSGSEKMAGALLNMAENALATKLAFTDAFADGMGAAKTTMDVAALSASFVELKKQGDRLVEIGKVDLGTEKIKAAAEAAEIAKGKFESLWAATTGAIKSSSDVEFIRASVKKFADEAGLGIGWVNSKMAELETAALKAREAIANADLAAAFKVIGITSEEALGKASLATGNIVTQLKSLEGNSKVSGEAFYLAFEKGISTAKTMADVELLSTSIQSAMKAGKLTVDQFNSAMALVSEQFQKVFDTKLKAASTTEDFRQLEAQVRASGMSASAMAVALDQIREKATGAKAAVQLLATQTTALADEAMKVTNAQNAAAKATLDIQSATNSVTAEQNNLRKDSLDVSLRDSAVGKAQLDIDKAKVVEAKAQLDLARAKAALAQLQSQQELATADLLIAKQQQLNSEKKLGTDTTNAANIEAVANAKREVDSKSLVLETTKQAVFAQQEVTSNIGQSVAEASQLVSNLTASKDQMIATAAAAEKLAGWVKNADGSIMNVATTSLQGVIEQLMQMGLGAEEAAKSAANFTGGMRTILAFGFEGVRAYEMVQAKIAKVGVELVAANAQAKSIVDTFHATTAAAKDSGAAGLNLLYITQNWGKAASLVAQAYNQIKQEAYDAGQTAVGVANNFITSMSSIHIELLKAQGNEEAAAQAQYEARKKQVTLEYELLKVKLMVAKIELQAAKVPTTEIEKAITDSASSYKQAMDDLKALDDLQRASRSAKAAEVKSQASSNSRTANANDPAAVKALQDSLVYGSTPPPAVDAWATSQLPTTSSVRPPTQPVPTVSQRIEVVLMTAQDAVSTYLDGADPTRLLALLNTAKATA